MIIKRIPLDKEFDNVYLDVYIADPTDNFTRKAILVIPGGGYQKVCSNREGEPIAMAFMPYGYNAFVLRYSVNGQKVFPGQLIEASLAMKHIKDNAEEYNIDPEKIFVTGFSAGGHLAASLGILWHLPKVYEATGMEYGYNKPAGMMLAYPVISSDPSFAHKGSFQNLLGKEEPTLEELEKVSLEKHVDEKSVPLYLMHTSNDGLVPVKNALALATAYAEAGKTFELHVYPDAPHGISLGNAITAGTTEKFINSQVERWIQDATIWANTL
ncbi:MAG: alpha/beta hydrolase [Clostridia bacterium]|nr:alpha/beta hydrolase [Clostridia bacterium]